MEGDNASAKTGKRAKEHLDSQKVGSDAGPKRRSQEPAHHEKHQPGKKTYAHGTETVAKGDHRRELGSETVVRVSRQGSTDWLADDGRINLDNVLEGLKSGKEAWNQERSMAYAPYISPHVNPLAQDPRIVIRSVLRKLVLVQGVLVLALDGSRRDAVDVLGDGTSSRVVAFVEQQLRQMTDSSRPADAATLNNLGCTEGWLLELDAAQTAFQSACKAASSGTDLQKIAQANLKVITDIKGT